MPPQSRKRRAPVEEEEDDVPTPTQTQQSQRRRSTPDEDDVELEEDEEEEERIGNSSGSIVQLSKSLVRYALSCEYARIPIKRLDVNQKVLGSHTREFRKVFDAANSQLLDVFGMELVELPNREKVTMRQKRAAAASDSQNKTSNQWVLRNVLPDQFRTSDILAPSHTPNPEIEATYVGLYTMVIALISLAGGTLSEGKLDRFLKRMNADTSTPMDSTDKVLAKMNKEGYIHKVKDTSGGEELIDYIVGPRGKVEIGEDAIAKMVKTVYAGSSIDDLDARLNRSLGLGEGGVAVQPPTVNGEAATATAQGEERRGPGRPRRRREEEEDY